MRITTLASRVAGILITVAPLTGLSAFAQTELTLAEAERLALEQAPWLQQYRNNANAAAERTVYEGRLPDPQLTFGFVNVPTPSYSLRQEDMTMTMIGVRQTFPPGNTLALRTNRAESMSERENARLEVERRGLLKRVRATWLEIYYAEQGQRLLETARDLAQRDLEATESRYRAAQEMQRMLFRARQALARIDERLPTLRAAAVTARAQLQRWIGTAAREPLSDAPPSLPSLPTGFDPTRHPEWLAVQADLGAARAEVGMAREDYKPGWMLDLSYGFRRPMPNGVERADMVSAMVTLDMPIFRDKRQDRRLAERQAREAAARYGAEDKRRELETLYDTWRTEYDALAARVQVFEQALMPAIQRELHVTLAGFAREQTERRDARMKQLNAELELLRLRVDLAKTQNELLYLTGEPS